MEMVQAVKDCHATVAACVADGCYCWRPQCDECGSTGEVRCDICHGRGWTGCVGGHDECECPACHGRQVVACCFC